MINISNIHKSYGKGDGQVEALRGLNLDIEKGEFLCIWGASGSGKSTLLNMIGMLDKPDSGSIVVDDNDILSMSDKALSEYRSNNVGFIFQNFNLISVLSAVENVMIPLQVAGIKESIARERTVAILKEVGLGDKLNKRPDEMSGGQRQRVAIARALVGKPSLILADEPTANLDSVTGESIISLMKELNETHKVTYIFSTHDSQLLEYASRNVYLKDGLVEVKNSRA